MPVYVYPFCSGGIVHSREGDDRNPYIALTKSNHRAFLLQAHRLQVAVNSKQVAGGRRELQDNDVLVLSSPAGRHQKLRVVLDQWTHLSFDEQSGEWQGRKGSCFKVKPFV